MLSLLERKVLVTGGSRGIGASIVRRFVNDGAAVAFTFMSNELLATSLRNELQGLGAQIECFPMDVRDRAQVRKGVQNANDFLGGLDVLVLNAGINAPADFDELTDSAWADILETNLVGPFRCAQEALPYLEANAPSSVVSISSVSGQYGGPRTAHYAASKAGLISMTQVLARFGAPRGIRANSVAAGFVESEMTVTAASSPVVAAAVGSVPLRRLGAAHEVAAAASFLASSDSSYVTGQTINVNGGLYF